MQGGSLGTAMLRRLIESIPVLFLASIIVFSMLRLIPGDPATIIGGEDATPADIALIRAELGIDKPLVIQYTSWLGDMVTGDFGTSFITNRSVASLISAKLPATLELAAAAYILALVVGIPFGIIAGLRPRGIGDYALSVFTMIGIGIPNFFFAIILLLIFSVQLDWLPAAGRADLFEDPILAIKKLTLPTIALGFTFAAILARFTRSSIMDVMGEDYIRTARAKGLAERRVVIKHAMRNGLIPLVTVIGLQVGRLLAGALIIEVIFTWPGIGQLIISSIRDRDYLVVQTLLMFLVAGFIIVNLIVDLTYTIIDPRLRTR